jgi:hypothetical protein
VHWEDREMGWSSMVVYEDWGTRPAYCNIAYF